MELLVLVAVACSGGLSQQEADSLVATEVAITLTQEPEHTQDIAATVSAAVQGTQAMMPTQTSTYARTTVHRNTGSDCSADGYPQAAADRGPF